MWNIFSYQECDSVLSLGITFEWEGILTHYVHDIISVSLKVSAESIQASRAKEGDRINCNLCV